MENKIVLDFKNIVSELKNKELKLCFLRNRGLFIEDVNGNLYMMETYRIGSYLDKLVKDGIVVEFNPVGVIRSKNIGEWEKEVWEISEVEAFIKRHCL